MKIVKLNSSQFDKFASTHKYRNFYQTSMYGNVMNKFSYETLYIGIVNNENKLVGASLILTKEVFMNNKIAYAPRGILFDYEDKKEVFEIINKLKKYLANKNIMYLSIDPYIPLTIRDSEGNIINFNNKGNVIIENLKTSEFTYRGKTLFFETKKPRWEALVLLNRDLKDISSRLDKKTRNKINRGENNGISIVKDENQTLNKLYSFIEKKGKKPLSFYKELVNQFGNDIEVYYAVLSTEQLLINTRRNLEKEEEYNNSLNEKLQDTSMEDVDNTTDLNKKMESDRLLTVYKENLEKATDLLKNNPDGLIIGGTLIIKYDNAAYVLAEGIDEKFGYLNVGYLLKWHLIQTYNEESLKYINLNAVVGEFEEQNQYSGLNESKLGFDSTITEYIGEFNIVINNFTYNLYKKMNKNK